MRDRQIRRDKKKKPLMNERKMVREKDTGGKKKTLQSRQNDRLKKITEKARKV